MTTDSWTRKADFPGLPLTNAVCFVLQGQAYIGFGQSNVYPYSSLQFFAYDPSTDTWTQKTALAADFATNLSPLGLSINGKGYLVTNPGSNAVFEYDPVLDQWTELSDFPGGGRLYASGFTIGNKGYLVGGGAGNTGASQRDCWQYDPGTDQWTRKADPPVELYGDVGFSINGKGYVGNDEHYYRLFFGYDPVADRWTNSAPFPELSGSGAAS